MTPDKAHMKDPRADESGGESLPRSAAGRAKARHIWVLVMLGLVVGVVGALVLVARLHPHATARILRSWARPAATSLESVPDPPADEDPALLPPPPLGSAEVEGLLGFSHDRTLCFLQVFARDPREPPERSIRHSIWKVDLATGLTQPVIQGERVAVNFEDQGVLVLQRPRTGQQPVPLFAWLPDFLELHFLDWTGRMSRLATGDLDQRWFGLSPDQTRTFYHLRDDSGLRPKILEIKSAAESDWPPVPETGEPAGALGKSEQAFLVAWLRGDEAFLRMVQRPVALPEGGQGIALARFENRDVRTGRLLDSLPVPGDRILKDGPFYNKAGHFHTFSRMTSAPLKKRMDQVDLYACNPLRRVATTDATGVYWAPDGRFATIERIRETDGRFSSRVGLWSADSEELKELDLADCVPPFERLLPHSFSPDSRMFLAASYQESRLGIVDRETGEVVRVIEHLGASQALWSPDGRWIACLGRREPVADQDGFLVDMTQGEAVALTLPRMRPLGWPDAQTVLFLNRWTGEDVAIAGPLQIARVDARTRQTQLLRLH